MFGTDLLLLRALTCLCSVLTVAQLYAIASFLLPISVAVIKVCKMQSAGVYTTSHSCKERSMFARSFFATSSSYNASSTPVIGSFTQPRKKPRFSIYRWFLQRKSTPPKSTHLCDCPLDVCETKTRRPFPDVNVAAPRTIPGGAPCEKDVLLSESTMPSSTAKGRPTLKRLKRSQKPSKTNAKGRSKKITPHSASHLLGGGCNREDGLLGEERPDLNYVYKPEDDEARMDLLSGGSEREADWVDIAIFDMFGGGCDQHDRSVSDSKVGKTLAPSSKKVSKKEKGKKPRFSMYRWFLQRNSTPPKSTHLCDFPPDVCETKTQRPFPDVNVAAPRTIPGGTPCEKDVLPSESLMPSSTSKGKPTLKHLKRSQKPSKANAKGRSNKSTPHSASHLWGGGCNREDGLLGEERPDLNYVYNPEDDEARMDLLSGGSEREADWVDIAIFDMFGGGCGQHDRSVSDAKVEKTLSPSSKKVRWFQRHSERSTKTLISR